MQDQGQPTSAAEADRHSADAGQSSASFEQRLEQDGSGDVIAPLLIGGEEIEGGESFAVQDPGKPGHVVGRAVSATREQAQAAVDAADRAFADWSRLTPERRAELLVEALGTLGEDAEHRARTLTGENGKVLSESQIELQVFVGRCTLAAEMAPRLSEVRHLAPETQEATPGLDSNNAARQRPPIAFRSEVQALPLGVVTIIVPYNWPIAILAAALPYALVAGNTVVVKPPPTTPLAITLTLRHLARKLPPGVLNVVSGSNDAVAPLITDSRVRRLVFTGSTGAGKKMMEMCAGNLARITLELGGNDPAIVLDDANLDEATIKRLVISSFLTSGQVCMGIKRVYVHRSRYQEVVDGMTQVLSGYVTGHGLDPRASMGPLNNEKQREIVRTMRDEARAAGCEIRELGEMTEEAASGGGWFLKPTLVLDPDPKLAIVDQEQFGPALPILPFDDLDPLIEAVNNHWSGLCSSVWSRDLDRAASIARRLRTGTTWINNANAVAEDDRAPFGGFRQSGVGRELGEEGLMEFTEAHTVTFPAGDTLT